MRTTLGIVPLFLVLVCGCVINGTAPRVSPIRPPAIVLTNSSSEFRQYDEVVLNAIQNRWYNLLDNQPRYGLLTGNVVVSCRLHVNGVVSDVVVMENTCEDIAALMCQKAILDPSPYQAWPEQMQKMIGKDYRTLKLNFSYDAGQPTNEMLRTRR
jgi:hypothetical protein